jgi:hypothetical protein
MSSSSSARIQIQKGRLINGKYGVDDRSMPAILMISSSSSSSSRMNVNEWNNMCDQVDDIVLPLNNIMRGCVLLCPISFAIFIAVCISLAVTPRVDIDLRIIPISGLIVPSAFIVVLITTQYSSNKIEKAFLEVNQVCEINSQKYANKLISFDLCDDTTIVRDGTRHMYSENSYTYHDRYILVSIVSNHPNDNDDVDDDVDDDVNDVEFGATGGVGAGAGVLSLPPAVDKFAAATTTTIDVDDDVNDVELGATGGAGAGAFLRLVQLKMTWFIDNR